VNLARRPTPPPLSADPALPRVKPIRRTKARKPSRIIEVLSSAVTWLAGCVFAGVAVTVAGVFILSGVGWSLIAVGVFLFLIAWLIRVGITNA
jgi:hypothetical protein